MRLNKNIKLLIAVDGGAGSGKSTAAKLLSKKYGLNYLSSGLLYRYVAHKLLSKKNMINNNSYIKKIAQKINKKKLNNKQLFSPEVTSFSAIIAKSKKIRIFLRPYQKGFAKQNLVCIEGRDIASKICPHADIKLFFQCSLEVRARRRLKDFKKINKNISLREVKKALKHRDLHDINRKESPLKRVKDSVLIDTSKLNKKQMLTKISRIVEKRLLKKYGRFKYK